jgi:S-adenosylmethionine synthetase
MAVARSYLFTSESVTEGHPDKICDQISDAVLDEFLKQDPDSRVAVETLTTTGIVVVAGEVTSMARFDIQDVVRRTIREIGYDNPLYGFDADSCSVLISLHSQSPDISRGISSEENKEQGAGDQGLMFGYATNETEDFMPMPILLAHNLTKRLAEVRKNKEIPWARPDGKSQVTIEYENGRPRRVEAIVISTQHSPEVTNDQIRKDVIEKVIKPVCGKLWNDRIKIHVNQTGRFVIGGPPGDAGLTGRKIIVDTYGGMGRHGGGAFSGKDPSKVDRSACYMCRYIAKNVVAARLADRCELQVAYAIGVAEPVSLMINTFGTNKIPEEQIENIVRKNFDMRPSAIITSLNLKNVTYRKTAAYGHFGRNEPEFTWERTDKAEILRKAAGH